MAGAGGAARAVGLALADAGVARITVLNRDPARAETVAAVVAGAGVATAAGPIADIGGALREADLLINATSIGLQPGAAPLFDYGLLAPPLIVSDLVFFPSETPFLKAARERGCRTMNGLGMLLHQAVLSFQRWTGHPAPAEIMRSTLAEVLAARERAAKAA
jgi:shikimate dehydrogenase